MSCISHYVEHLKQEYPFLTEVDSIIIRKSLFNLEDAFKRYFKKQGNYPKYKSKYARNYYLHKITKQITDNYDIITTEKLQTKNMLQNKKISKNISDASFFEIIRQLQYKSQNKGKYFYQIDTFYPSSQTCSVCNTIDKKYKALNERTYNCSNCGNVLDRDLNASCNIMFEGIKLYMKNYA